MTNPPEKPLNLPWTPAHLTALQLISTGHFSARTLWRIRNASPDWVSSVRTSKTLPLSAAQQVALKRALQKDIRPLMQRMEAQQIRLLLPEDAEFPATLQKMEDPPFAIFLRGAPLKDGVHIAIVGTRNMTPYGKRVTALLSRELTHHGATIVSGLAFGVDLEAHEQCLNAGGKTIAVLPGGIDTASIMPPAHTNIAERFVRNGRGTLLSEYPPESPVQRFHYLIRNRLIAALADAVIVTEGNHQSGALVTARLALEGGREVLAVPGDIFFPTCRGTNALIADGARPCRSAADVLAALGFKNTEQAKQIAEARREIPTTPQETRILDALGTPRSVDELSRFLQEPVAQMSATVSLLELKGRIISVGPRTYITNQA